MKILSESRSGSQGGQTFSRNRFGQYVRNRAVPVNPRSVNQQAVRARLSNNAAAWRALTDSQRAAWTGLGYMILRTDSLGQSYNLTGFQSYVMVNNNRLAAGDAIVSTPPSLTDPGTLLTATLTLTSSSFSAAYTATPLASGVRLFIYASPQTTAGRSFQGDARLIQVSAAAAASPLNVLAAYSARFGAPVTGNKIFVNLVLYQAGFLGSALKVAQVVA